MLYKTEDKKGIYTMKSMYENEMKLEFVSKSNNEAFARISVAAFAAQLDPTIEELADIKTAVSEAVTNCIIHGYEDREGIIKLKCKIMGNTIVTKITMKKIIQKEEVSQEDITEVLKEIGSRKEISIGGTES